MAKIERHLEMPVSIEALYQAITDYEKYPEFVAEVRSAKVQKKSENRTEMVFELEIVKKFKYVLDFKTNPKTEVSWKLVESDIFKKNQGRWLLKAASSNKTIVEYELEVDFGFLVPGFVSKKLTEVTLPVMFKSFEDRAKQLM